MDADETGAFAVKLVHTHGRARTLWEPPGRVFVDSGEGHESCKHSKCCLSPLNLPDLPTAANLKLCSYSLN